MPLIQTPPDEQHEAPTLGARLKAAAIALITPTPVAAPPTGIVEPTPPPAAPTRKGISDAAVANLCASKPGASTTALLTGMFPPRPGI